MLRHDPRLPAVRVRELIEPLGFVGGQSIVNEYVREVRPLFSPRRTFQRTVYRPGEICQFDLWQPSREVPVGHGQTRKGFVVVAALGYSRAGAGALIFSKEPPDLLWGMVRCLWSLQALPQVLVWDREGSLHAVGGRPTQAYAAFCGQLKVDWLFCEPGDPQAKGVVERLQGYFETNFEPGRRFSNHLDFHLQLDAWFEKANARQHRTCATWARASKQGDHAFDAGRLSALLFPKARCRVVLPRSCAMAGSATSRFWALGTPAGPTARTRAGR